MMAMGVPVRESPPEAPATGVPATLAVAGRFRVAMD
jgi:hypothetical protein